MRRILLITALITALLAPQIAVYSQASAVDIFGGCGSGSTAGVPGVCTDAASGQNHTTKNPIVGAISDVINVLSVIVGVAAVIGLIVSGIRLALANGDSSSIATARQALIYSLVGVAVALLAQVIVQVILSQF